MKPEAWAVGMELCQRSFITRSESRLLGQAKSVVSEGVVLSYVLQEHVYQCKEGRMLYTIPPTIDRKAVDRKRIRQASIVDDR